MRLSRQFQASLFFYEKILKAQKAPICKINNFLDLRSFRAWQIVAIVVYCSLILVALVDFYLICVFVRSKFFRKKIIDSLEIVLITSLTILL